MKPFFTAQRKPRSEIMPIEIEESEQFRKDLKKLTRKFPSLPEDIEIVKRAAIELYHEQNLDNQSVFEIPSTGGDIKFFKVRKFACKSLKGRGNRSGIRIIYAWFPEQKKAHLIEIYYKGNQANEDKARIRDFLRSRA